MMTNTTNIFCFPYYWSRWVGWSWEEGEEGGSPAFSFKIYTPVVLTTVSHLHSSSLMELYCTRANAFSVGNGGPFPRDRAKTSEVLQLIHFLD